MKDPRFPDSEPGASGSPIDTPDKLIISPDEAKRRITGKGPSGPGGKYAVSRAEAVSIAVQIGQEVYDQLRGEHALAMGQLSDDLQKHFGEIRRITAANILDIQRRSFSYRIRRDFDVDLQRMAAKLRDWWDWIGAWLELHGLRGAPARTAGTLHVPVPEGMENYALAPDPEPENVGAPTELPESPEVARAFTLSSHEHDSGP